MAIGSRAQLGGRWHYTRQQRPSLHRAALGLPELRPARSALRCYSYACHRPGQAPTAPTTPAQPENARAVPTDPTGLVKRFAAAALAICITAGQLSTAAAAYASEIADSPITSTDAVSDGSVTSTLTSSLAPTLYPASASLPSSPSVSPVKSTVPAQRQAYGSGENRFVVEWVHGAKSLLDLLPAPTLQPAVYEQPAVLTAQEASLGDAADGDEYTVAVSQAAAAPQLPVIAPAAAAASQQPAATELYTSALSAAQQPESVEPAAGAAAAAELQLTASSSGSTPDAMPASLQLPVAASAISVVAPAVSASPEQASTATVCASGSEQYSLQAVVAAVQQPQQPELSADTTTVDIAGTLEYTYTTPPSATVATAAAATPAAESAQQLPQPQMSAAAAAVAPPPAAAPRAPAAVSRGALSVITSESEALSLPPLPTQYPELPPVSVPTFQEAVLSNGVKVILLEDHEVPLVRGSIIMRGGTHASPADKVGLASISMAVQRSGGTESLPGPLLDLKLEELAAGVETGAGAQGLTVDFYCNKEDTTTVLKLWADVLMHPALPTERISFYQDQILNVIDHRNDDATQVARRELQKLIYGRDSIYAREPTREGIKSITREDLQKFLSTWERPDAAVLGVVGDFTPSQMLSQLEELIGSWKPAQGQPAEPPQRVREADIMAPAAQSAGKVFLVNRPGLVQAAVAAGEPGVSLMDPDAYALDILSTSLNSFGGQLFDQLRSREGLAYSVYGAWDLPPDRPGMFNGGGETSAPGNFITGLRRVLTETTRTPPPNTVLDDARSEALNAFVFNFASKSAQLQRTLVYELLGLPRDLLFKYRDGIRQVAPQGVLEAAQRHLHPEEQITVVVGDAAQIGPQLEAAGLKPIPLSVDDI